MQSKEALTQSIMKISSYLLATALLAPATIVVGLSAPIAASVAAIAGVLSVLMTDYGSRRFTYLEPTRVAAKSEKLALAA